MGTYIVLAVLIVIVILAVSPTIRHIKGEGGCCGGAPEKKVHKRLTAPKMGEKQIVIEGMHCTNCKNRIENAVNQLDGVVCRVNLHKKTAKVVYSVPVEDNTLKKTIEKLDYRVVSISERG